MNKEDIKEYVKSRAIKTLVICSIIVALWFGSSICTMLLIPKNNGVAFWLNVINILLDGICIGVFLNLLTVTIRDYTSGKDYEDELKRIEESRKEEVYD